jgi:hypothetical protein
MLSTTLSMTQQSNAKHLPGYTGYRPQYIEERTNFPLPQMEKQVGRVPGKRSLKSCRLIENSQLNLLM